ARALARGTAPERNAARVLCWLGAAAAATVIMVTRGGGDFMFARFFLPVTPFLLLCIEAGIHALPRPLWRVIATALCLALIGVGVVRKHSLLGDKRNVAGIVDEPQFYPESRLQEIREAA